MAGPVSGYLHAILNAVREVVAQSQKPSRRAGVVVARDSDTTGALVIFDGDVVAVPVKCFANVDAFPGDRVGLARIDSDWIIFGSYGRHGPSTESVHVATLGADTVSGTSYEDIDGGHPFAFRKQYEQTRVRLHMHLSTWPTAAGDAADIALNVSGGTGDVLIAHYLHTAVEHEGYGGHRVIDLPAGLYTIGARWRNTAGSAINVDLFDSLSMSAEEIAASQSTGEGHTGDLSEFDE